MKRYYDYLKHDNFYSCYKKVIFIFKEMRENWRVFGNPVMSQNLKREA